MHVIMVGSAGVGKSLLLNALAGSVLFRTRGADTTTNFITKTHETTTYSDTPGLEDIEPRERAALQISSALQAGGNFKLVFVTVLEHGRARLSDILTIRVVLHAVKPVLDALGVAVRFSILVNMCRPQIMEGLADRVNLETLRGYYSLAEQSQDWDFASCGLGFLPLMEDLVGRNNVLIDCPDTLREFMASAPEVRVPYGRGIQVGTGFNSKTIAQMEQLRKRKSSMSERTLMFTSLARIASNLEPIADSESAPLRPTGPHIMMIGNPAAGKSTLLNCLAGSHLFPSGAVGVAGSKTVYFATKRYDSTTYTDTPGLHCAATLARDRAAEQISQALRRGGTFKLIFVTTLDDGHVRPEDVTTMRLTIRAIEPLLPDHDMSARFSVLINRVAQKQVRQLEQSADKVEVLRALYSEAGHVDHVGIIPRRRDANDKNDVLFECSDDLRDFITTAPEVTLPVKSRARVQTSDYDMVLSAVADKGDLVWRRIDELDQKQPAAVQSALAALVPSFTFGSGATLLKGMANTRVLQTNNNSSRSRPHVTHFFHRLAHALR